MPKQADPNKARRREIVSVDKRDTRFGRVISSRHTVLLDGGKMVACAVPDGLGNAVPITIDDFDVLTKELGINAFVVMDSKQTLLSLFRCVFDAGARHGRRELGKELKDLLEG